MILIIMIMAFLGGLLTVVGYEIKLKGMALIGVALIIVTTLFILLRWY